MFDIIINPYHNHHMGFENSLENDDRINYVIEKLLQSNINYVIVTKKDIDKYDIKLFHKIVDNINKNYKNIKTWNCYKCTFQNNLINTQCDICGYKNTQDIKLISHIDGDTTYYCKNSDIAIITCLKTIMYGIDTFMNNKNNTFLLIRPPGHHSTLKTMSGFCIINNIFVGVTYFQKKYNIRKIAIIDWDVHHGNGTQEIFYDRDDVLFIDIHRYDGINFYPKTGSINETGIRKGKGYTINIPLDKGANENVYLDSFMSTIIPNLKTYEPEIIIISAGFDAHIDDPIGGMKLSSSSFKKFHNLITTELNTRLIYFLEGGYNKEAVAESICNIVSC